MSDETMSDFLKCAYQIGKIKDVSEAFDEFNPEEEIHKGKTEFWLKEKTESYDEYSVGDIVFVDKYTYDDGKTGRNHLFVIIEQNNLVVPIESFGMLISSQIQKLKYKANKLLEADEKNGLRVDSIVKTDVIYRIKTEQILFKIGNVDYEKIEEYKKYYLNQNKS